MNELSTLAKFISDVITNDTKATASFGDRFYSEFIPNGEPTDNPTLMFVTNPGKDTRGAFGIRLKTNNTYQIKAVIEGTDFAPLEDGADEIDRLFDWQNQLDVDAGRPKSQVVYIDPENSDKQLMIMSMKRVGNLRYGGMIDAVNYCHLGGEYEIEYYVLDSLLQPVMIGDETMTQGEVLQEQIDILKQGQIDIMTALKNNMVDQVDAQIIGGSATSAAIPLPVPPSNKNIELYERTLSANLADYAYATSAPGRKVSQGFTNSASSGAFIWTINAQPGDVFNGPDLVAATSFTLANGETRTFQNTATGVWDEV